MQDETSEIRKDYCSSDMLAKVMAVVNYGNNSGKVDETANGKKEKKKKEAGSDEEDAAKPSRKKRKT